MIIYVATNTINDKQYVGQTIGTLQTRKNRHLNDARKINTTMAFHNAIRKYGKDVFIWKVLETCNSVDKLNECEQRYILLLNTLSPNGYNLETGGKNHTILEDTRTKMSASKQAKYVGKDNPFYGKTHTEEAKKRLSDLLKGHEVSEETRRKISESMKGIVHSKEATRKQSETMKKVSARKRAKFNKALGLGGIS